MSEVRNPFYEEGVIAERERILRLLNNPLVPEVLSRINPAVVNYNQLMQLIIDLVKVEEDLGNCDTCNVLYDLSSTQGRCGDCGECAEHCDHVPADGLNQ